MINKNVKRPLIVTILVLLVPLIGMLFAEEMLWTLSDFVILGVLIFGISLAYELISKRVNTVAYKTAVGIALFASLLLVWINGAVGIIGNENNPANLLYFGVLMVGIIGTIIARLDPRKMEYTMFAMALTQFMVPIIALFIWRPDFSFGVVGVLIINFFFVMMFAVSGLLFKVASTASRA